MLYDAPVTSDHRLQHRAPAIGTVHVTRPQRTPLDIAELVEYELENAVLRVMLVEDQFAPSRTTIMNDRELRIHAIDQDIEESAQALRIRLARKYKRLRAV